MEKYQKVLKLMQSKPDGLVRMDDADLRKLLGDKLASYRIPMYMSNIRKKANLAIKGIRDGRKVVAYQLVAIAPTVTPTETASPAIPPAVDHSSPEQPSEEPGIAQPLVIADSPASESAPTDDGWSI